MVPSRKEKRERNFFDVRRAGNPSSKNFLRSLIYGKNVLNLRPAFRARHPFAWIAGCVVLVVVVFFGVRLFSLHADVQDFYPSICLGNWQNTANAQGHPETMASGAAFSAENSALSNGLNTQIFCGGFLGNNVPTSSDITNVGLTFMWQIGDAVAATTSDSGATGSAIMATSSDETIGTSSTDSTNLTPDNIEPTSSAENVSTTEESVPAVSSTTDTGTLVPEDNSSSGGAAATPDATPPPAATPSPATTPPPAPAPADSSDNSPSSFIPPPRFFSWFIPAARADDDVSQTEATDDGNSTTATGDDATQTVILGAPLIANLSADTSSSAPSSPEEASASTTTTVVTVPPAPPDENFLDVSYSVDGQTWVSVGKVNTGNWQKFTVTLPISDWTDLANLQIRVQGIPTTQDPLPPVYLGGMLMEVHYKTPANTIMPEAPSSTLPETPSTTPPVRLTLVNPGAEQTCGIEPFSQSLPLGGIAQFTAVLHPSINGMSYDLSTGYLPHGVAVLIGQPSGSIAATSSITFQAASDAQRGSFNVSVIYHEQETDGSTISNFCQLNLTIQ